MEGHMSKKSLETSAAMNIDTNLQDTTDQLSSGEAAFKIEAGLHSFDTNQLGPGKVAENDPLLTGRSKDH
ncbi:hypothetical protein ACE6H2_027091 [Prunus campanulata]